VPELAEHGDILHLDEILGIQMPEPEDRFIEPFGAAGGDSVAAPQEQGRQHAPAPEMPASGRPPRQETGQAYS